ncbi:MAG TPA: zinc ribbon domain-containing protein [Bryobacteraceae bacterium]|nr:zinc ribbon domain-containing protein [Bryobacteraceae bacterium]
MTSVSCPKCQAPLPETARFCLKCGARIGRRPEKPFTFLTLILFTVVGALIALAVLPRLAPGSFGRSRKQAAGAVDRDATVIADSFCSESDTQILQLYAVIAQGDRNAAAALVLRESTLAVPAGTVVHEHARAGRLSRIEVASSEDKSRMCWIPSIMLTGVIGRGASPRATPVIIESPPSEPN